MGIAFWFGLIWRRANSATAWASFLGAAFVFLLCETKVVEVSLPLQMLLYLTAGIAAGFGATFFSPRLPKKQLDDFYLTLHTPIGQEQKLRDAGVEFSFE